MKELIELLEADGYSAEQDPPLFRYVEWWEASNQFAPLTPRQKYEIIKSSYGFKQYLETGDVLLEDD